MSLIFLSSSCPLRLFRIQGFTFLFPGYCCCPSASTRCPLSALSHFSFVAFVGCLLSVPLTSYTSSLFFALCVYSSLSSIRVHTSIHPFIPIFMYLFVCLYSNHASCRFCIDNCAHVVFNKIIKRLLTYLLIFSASLSSSVSPACPSVRLLIYVIIFTAC